MAFPYAQDLAPVLGFDFFVLVALVVLSVARGVAGFGVGAGGRGCGHCTAGVQFVLGRYGYYFEAERVLRAQWFVDGRWSWKLLWPDCICGFNFLIRHSRLGT